MDNCIVRQAIKDLKTDAIIGYELVIQDDGDSLYDAGNDSVAANAMVAFLSENSKRIFNDNRTFMTFTPALLFRNTPKIFDSHKIVIQIEDNIVIHPLAAVLIGKYREEGYSFAINDFQFTPKYFSMLEYVDFIKVNIGQKREESQKKSLLNLVEMAHGFHKEFIAIGVNTKEDYDFAKELAVDYVEGNFISHEMKTKSSKTDFLQGNLYQLILEVTKDEPNIDVLEQIVSRDAGLTYALLKMANSAYFSANHQITSIRQGIVRVGISQLKQWVYLLSFGGEGDNASEELLKTSFLRANFASTLAKKVKRFGLSGSDAYLMGMFSTLEYMIDATMEDILAEIPISEEVKKALINGEGKAGELYKLIMSYERADWAEIKKMTDELNIQTSELAQVYMDCVEEVNEIWTSIMGLEVGGEEL